MSSTETGSRNIVSDALLMSGIETRTLPHCEALVGFGFRCAMNADLYNAAQWMRTCNQVFNRELDGGDVQGVLYDLMVWRDAVRSCSLRRIELLPSLCWSFCRDECLAVTLVAASEHRACPALQICAYTLLGNAEIAPVLDAAKIFGHTLRQSGVAFSSSSVNAASLTHTLH